MRHVLLAVSLLMACAPAALAQPRNVADAPGRWKPWMFTASPITRTQLGARPADVKELEAQLLRLNTLIKNTDGVTHPIGFSVQTSGVLGMAAERSTPFPGEPAFTARPLPANLNFGAFPILEYGSGATAKREDGGETALLLFFVNQPLLPLHQYHDRRVPEFEKLDTDVVLLAKPQPDLFGLPRYGSDAVVITKTDAPIWAAVNLAEALELAARSISQRLAEQRDTVARLQASYDDRTDPAKRERRMAEYRQLARLNPDKTFMDQMAKVDEELARTAAQLLPHIARERDTAAKVEQELADAKALAAGLSTADQAAPACYAAAGGPAVSRFRRAPQADCGPLVRPNWALFNPALPRSAPQLLVITRFERCLPPNPPARHVGGCKANLKLLEAMDKAALRAWLQ